MSKSFDPTCHPDFVEVMFVEKAMFGRERLLREATGIRCPPSSGHRRFAFLRWERGSAKWRGDVLRVPTRSPANFRRLADAIGLPPPAPVMVDVSFHGGAITSGNPYIQTDWKLTTYQSSSRSGTACDWTGAAIRGGCKAPCTR